MAYPSLPLEPDPTPAYITHQSYGEYVKAYAVLPPARQGALVMINGSSLNPTPFVNVSVEKFMLGTAQIGGIWKISMNGQVVGNSFGDVTRGLRGILDLAKKGDCVEVIIECSGDFIRGKGRVASSAALEGSWIQSGKYTIDVDLYENYANSVVEPNSSSMIDGKYHLKSFTEDITFAITDDTFSSDGVPAISSMPTNVGCKNTSTTGMALIKTYFGNQHAKATFSIAAEGIYGGCPYSSGVYGLLAAEGIITKRLGALANLRIEELVGVEHPTGLCSNLDAGSKYPPGGGLAHSDAYNSGIPYLSFRSVSINPLQGSISVNGEIIYRPSGLQFPGLFTTLTIEESTDSEGRTVTVSGTVKALSKGTQSYDNIVAMASTQAARPWNNRIQDNGRMVELQQFLDFIISSSGLDVITQIASFSPVGTTQTYIADSCVGGTNPCVSQGPANSCAPVPSPSLNPVVVCGGGFVRVLSSQISKNYGEGTGSFSIGLSNKPNSGANGFTKLDVDVTHNKPADTVVEVVVPGRGSKGPIIQNICCKTADKYSITISANTNTSNPSYVSSVLSSGLKVCVEKTMNDLQKEYELGCWFITNNEESFGNASYRLSKAFIKPSCP